MKNTFLFLMTSVILSTTTTVILCQNVGSASFIEVNEIYLPFNNRGVIADVNINPNGQGGKFANGWFLYSAGFWLSGYNGDSLWANGVSTSQFVEDYQAGTVGMDPNDPKSSIYKLTSSDTPFGQSWQEWSDAVDLGADFYDGNNDGIYNPVDLNGNNQWDTNEDKPDFILDETYWCVFNDGVPRNLRRWQSEPQGIEIRQTIFAEGSSTPTANVVFVRYRIKNTGTVSDTLKDVYFSNWADADIGDSNDDVYGCDTLRQGVFFYNDSTDLAYGDSVPSFMMDMLTGPFSYIPGESFIDLNGNNIYENGIDTPLDTAINYLGPIGIRIFPGAKNLQLSSCTTNQNSDGTEAYTVNEARNYMLGFYKTGEKLDPCTWPKGEVMGGVPCNQVNPFFWCSGDPVTNIGWISTLHRDVRGVGTSGPITLIKNQEIEILIGYEIDRSTTPLGGITAVRTVSDAIQTFSENNFGYPIVSVEDETPIVSEFKLDQNYPNPFNPITKIKFTIPTPPISSPLVKGRTKEGFVSLKVYDILGNEIATLVNEELSPGEYEVEFNGNSFPSGVYFYQLRIEGPETSLPAGQAGSGQGIIQTKKMVLMK